MSDIMCMRQKWNETALFAWIKIQSAASVFRCAYLLMRRSRDH